ncbi:MAG: LysR substrate-binding domain-containing protein [Azospirillaceae bacterium]
MRGPISRIASLDHLRCFVAVGRRMSITLAAEDLCLTQSAVSRQVQGLEDALGVALLTRGYRSIAFTPEGERLFAIADPAVQQLQDGMVAITAARERRPVTITASIGVTALWLLPRLGSFQRRHPDIDIRLAANNKLLDLRTDAADLAIRYCAERNAPPGARHLFGEVVMPVAHPSLATRRIDRADALAETILLEYDDPRRPWLQWSGRLEAMGLAEAKPRGILHFNQYDQVIQAALIGQGVALGRLALVEPMLADGRLVPVEGDRLDRPEGYGYWLIAGEDTSRPEVRTVVDWITDEARTVEARLAA